METQPKAENSEEMVPDLDRMSAEEFVNWVLSEPDPMPLSSFPLQFDSWRKEFLREYWRRGERARFEAVSHIWATLNEPREARCTAMGIAARTGGRGKTALMNLLAALLDELRRINGILPKAADYRSLDEWHEAVIASFDHQGVETNTALQKYADILNGGAEPVSKTPAQLIHGPWSTGQEPRG